jgi:hypothetical protein
MFPFRATFFRRWSQSRKITCVWLVPSPQSGSTLALCVSHSWSYGQLSRPDRANSLCNHDYGPDFGTRNMGSISPRKATKDKGSISPRKATRTRVLRSTTRLASTCILARHMQVPVHPQRPRCSRLSQIHLNTSRYQRSKQPLL